MLDPPTALKDRPTTPMPPAAVIREARRRQRRRWAMTATIMLGAVVWLMAVLLLVGRMDASNGARRSLPAPVAQVSAVSTSGIEPEGPGPLAVTPNGTIYIADDVRNQILARSPDGRFRVIAGTGAAGYSGDSGAATRAELDDPEGMAVAPDGTLFIADAGNRRVRAVSPSGVITTVAGDGAFGSWTPNGSVARSSALDPSAVAIGPDLDLYIASYPEILRLGPGGTLTRVLGTREYDGLNGISAEAPYPAENSEGGLAFDTSGDLYVAGLHTGTILMISPQGAVGPVPGIDALGDSSSSAAGGVVAAPGGGVLAVNAFSLVRATRHGVTAVPPFPQTTVSELDGVSGFSPDGIAVDRRGTIYVDTDFGNGFADRSALLAIGPGGHSTVLWEQGAHP